MKLSAAMETGWKLAPQSWTDGYARQDAEGNFKGVCALGAAYLGAYPAAKGIDINAQVIRLAFPETDDAIELKLVPEAVRRSLGGCKFETLGNVAEALNDGLHLPAKTIVQIIRYLGY